MSKFWDLKGLSLNLGNRNMLFFWHYKYYRYTIAAVRAMVLELTDNSSFICSLRWSSKTFTSTSKFIQFQKQKFFVCLFMTSSYSLSISWVDGLVRKRNHFLSIFAHTGVLKAYIMFIPFISGQTTPILFLFHHKYRRPYGLFSNLLLK